MKPFWRSRMKATSSLIPLNPFQVLGAGACKVFQYGSININKRKHPQTHFDAWCQQVLMYNKAACTSHLRTSRHLNRCLDVDLVGLAVSSKFEYIGWHFASISSINLECKHNVSRDPFVDSVLNCTGPSLLLVCLIFLVRGICDKRV